MGMVHDVEAYVYTGRRRRNTKEMLTQMTTMTHVEKLQKHESSPRHIIAKLR